MRVGRSNWSIEALPNWEAQDDGDLLTIYKSNGIGALQLDSATKNSGDVSQDDLDFYNKPEWGKPQRCQFGDFSGQTYKFSEAATLWQWWILANGSVMLRVTYNCDKNEEHVESEDVLKMLKTLKRE
jgi:hypothetical protein